MSEPELPADPILVGAIEQARKIYEAVRDIWTGGDDEEARDAAEEAVTHADNALTHLEHGRWDEADAAANLALELEEEFGDGTIWRDFALLVEEAAAIGRTG